MSDEPNTGRMPVSRRRILQALGGGAGIAAVTSGLDTDGDDGDLYGGTMALQEAYKFAEGPDGAVWIGPDSAKSNVDAKSGNVYLASDTEVDYYGDGGSWTLREVGSESQPVPAVHAERASSKSSPASITVYKDSGTIYAVGQGVNGVTHGLVDSGSDAATVLQSAVDDLPSTGGVIFIRQGTYDISSKVTITDKHGVHFWGEGKGLDAYGNDSGTTKLVATGDNHILEWNGTNIKPRGGGAHYIHLEGNSQTNASAGIHHTGDSDRFYFESVESENSRYGFLIEGSADAIHFINCGGQHNGAGLEFRRNNQSVASPYPKIIGGEYSDNGASGQSGAVFSGIVMKSCYGAKIIGVTAVRNKNNGIFIGRRNYDVHITGGTNLAANIVGVSVWDEGTGVEPSFITIGDATLSNNDIGCDFKNTGPCKVSGIMYQDDTDPQGAGNTQSTHVDVKTNTSVFVDNAVFYGGTTNIDDPNSNAVIGHNRGNKVTNRVLSGTFAIDSTGVKSVDIAHGLDITPAVEDCQLTIVHDTDVDDWAAGAVRVVSTGGTNVTAEVDVTSASATSSATAKLALDVDAR